METNKLIAGIVAAAIAIIVLAGVLMPALANATETERTFTNEGYFYMTEYETTDSITLSWDAATPAKVTVNSIEYDLPVIDGGAVTYTILATDNWIIRTDGVYYAQFMDVQGPVISSSNDSYSTMTVTAVNGSATVTNTNRTETPTYTEMYCISGDTGDYVSVMKKANVPAYVHGDTPLTAMGRSKVGNNSNVGVSIRGDIDNGVTVSEFTATGTTFSNVEIHYDAVSGFDDLYLFDKITMTGTLSGSSTDLTYNYIIVPAEVTGERSVQLSDAMNMILNVIPILILVAVLLGVVAVIILRRE